MSAVRTPAELTARLAAARSEAIGPTLWCLLRRLLRPGLLRTSLLRGLGLRRGLRRTLTLIAAATALMIAALALAMLAAIVMAAAAIAESAILRISRHGGYGRQ
jgi:hypothetical protein